MVKDRTLRAWLRESPSVCRFGRTLFVFSVLALVGLMARPLEQPAWARVKAGQPELNLAALEGALGQGLVIGVLGGFRAVVADFLFIRLNAIWEAKEREKMMPLLRLVTTIDPRPEFFWINGARMVAYDVPNWRIQKEGGYDVVPEARQDAIDQEQAELAFSLLRKALEFHAENPRIYLEFAQIYLNRLSDLENAAEWFLRASKKPDAPYYAARIHAELLRRMGKLEEALQFLRQLYKRLPDDEPFAQKEVVAERIQSLESALEP